MVRKTKRQKKSVAKRILKIKRVPEELKRLIAVPATLEESALADNSLPVPPPAHPPLPESVAVLVGAIAAGNVKEIVLHEDVEPTTWEKLVNWFMGDDSKGG